MSKPGPHNKIIFLKMARISSAFFSSSKDIRESVF